MIVKKKDEQSNSRPAARATYTTPMLKMFGPVGTLTLAGSANLGEMGMGGGMGMGMGMGMGAARRL